MQARIGVIGGGIFGQMHLRTFRQLQRDGKVVLAALCDTNQEVLTLCEKEFGVKCYTDHRQMLEKENLDGATVVTPDHLHRTVATDCLEAGVHVLVEKPLDVTVEGCNAMVAAARKNNLLLQVDFHKRYDPYHAELARLVANGAMGKIQYGYAHMEDKIIVPKSWFAKWAQDSSPAWFLGVHFYDLICWIIKSDAKNVYATGCKGKLSSLGIDTYDSIQAKIGFQNGSSFTVDSSWILPESFEATVNQSIRMVGSEGMMEIDSQNRGAESCMTKSGMATHNMGFFRETTDTSGNIIYAGYGIESIADFAGNVNCILDGEQPQNLSGIFCDGQQATQVTRIAVAIHKSIASGQVVEV